MLLLRLVSFFVIFFWLGHFVEQMVGVLFVFLDFRGLFCWVVRSVYWECWVLVVLIGSVFLVCGLVC